MFLKLAYLPSKRRFSCNICFKNIKFPRVNYQPIVPRQKHSIVLIVVSLIFLKFKDLSYGSVYKLEKNSTETSPVRSITYMYSVSEKYFNSVIIRNSPATSELTSTSHRDLKSRLLVSTSVYVVALRPLN